MSVASSSTPSGAALPVKHRKTSAPYKSRFVSLFSGGHGDEFSKVLMHEVLRFLERGGCFLSVCSAVRLAAQRYEQKPNVLGKEFSTSLVFKHYIRKTRNHVPRLLDAQYVEDLTFDGESGAFRSGRNDASLLALSQHEWPRVRSLKVKQHGPRLSTLTRLLRASPDLRSFVVECQDENCEAPVAFFDVVAACAPLLENLRLPAVTHCWNPEALQHMAPFFNMLATCKRLRYLDIGWAPATPEVISAMSGLCAGLESLRLCISSPYALHGAHYDIYAPPVSSHFTAVASLVEGCSCLQSLDLTNAAVSGRAILALASLPLKTLCLRNPYFEDDVMGTVVPFLQFCQKVKTLRSFSWSGSGSQPGAGLGAGLQMKDAMVWTIGRYMLPQLTSLSLKSLHVEPFALLELAYGLSFAPGFLHCLQLDNMWRNIDEKLFHRMMQLLAQKMQLAEDIYLAEQPSPGRPVAHMLLGNLPIRSKRGLHARSVVWLLERWGRCIDFVSVSFSMRNFPEFKEIMSQACQDIEAACPRARAYPAPRIY